MKDRLFGTIIPDALIARMDKAADPSHEGVRICVELIEELSTIPGVAGVHIMAPGNDAAIPETIEAARAKVKSANSLKLRATDANTKKGRPRGQPFHCRAVARLRRQSAALRA